ncbi:DmsC/YnfH family molybdoenzyme membrane anchor subunit [Shigella sonnei]
MLKKLSPASRTLWLVVTMVLGVVFVWMMVRVYNSIRYHLVQHLDTMGFFLTMFMGGPLLGYLLLSLAGVDGWAMCSSCRQPFLFWHW